MEQEPKRLKIDKVELVRQKGLRWYLMSRIYKDDKPIFDEPVVDKIMYYAKPTLIKGKKEKLLSLFASFFIPTHDFDSSYPIIFSSDSQKLITLHLDGIVIWDLNTSEGIRYGLRGRPVYSSDRKKIALLSKGRDVQIGNSLQDFYTNFSEMIPISSIDFSPDNKLIACGLCDNSIVVRDLETNSRTVFGDSYPPLGPGIYTHPIWSLRFIADGTQLASTSKSGLLLWNIKDATSHTLLESQDIIGSSAAHILAVRPQTKQLGKQLVSGSFDGTLRFWDLETGQCMQRFQGLNEADSLKNVININSIVFTSDGMQMIVGSAQELTLWNLRTGITTILNASGTFDQGGIGNVIISPDDNYVATVSGNGNCKVRDMRGFNKFSKKVGNKAFTMEEFTLFEKFATSALSLDDNQSLKIQEIMESYV
jgi:WD40 repeat protein